MKKFLSLLLAVLMVFSVFSFAVVAEEPETELPEIQLNFQATSNQLWKIDDNWKVIPVAIFSAGETFQLESNAPDTTYEVDQPECIQISDTALLTCCNNIENTKLVKLIAKSEGYKISEYYICLYPKSENDKIVFYNIEHANGYRTLVGKNPKVIFNLDNADNDSYDYVQSFNVKSSNTSVATVEYKRNKGKCIDKEWDNYENTKYLDIKCLSNGVTTITVSTTNGLRASFKLYVQKNDLSRRVIGIGEKIAPKYQDSKPLFNKNNSNIKFSGKYVVGNKVGKATASLLVDGVRERVYFEVRKAPTKIALNAKSIVLGKNGTFDLNSSVPKGCASYNRKYSSSNTSVATVHPTNGLVTAKKAGTCYVTVKTFNGKTAKCKVTVKGDPKKIIVSNPSIRMPYSMALNCRYFYQDNPKNKNKDYIQISAKTNNGTNGKFTYTSSDTRIIKVNSRGRVYINQECLDWDETWTYGKNTAYITIKAYNGITATVKVTVYNDAKECNTYAARGKREQYDYVVSRIKKQIPEAQEGKVTKADKDLRKIYEQQEIPGTYEYEEVWTGQYYTPYEWVWNKHNIAVLRTDLVSGGYSLKKWVEEREDAIESQIAKHKKSGHTHYALIQEEHIYHVVMW